jgi:hypothetical protein
LMRTALQLSLAAKVLDAEEVSSTVAGRRRTRNHMEAGLVRRKELSGRAMTNDLRFIPASQQGPVTFVAANRMELAMKV